MKTNSSISRPKRVQFSKVVKVHGVKCIDDYTASERSKIWIDANGYSRIRENNRSIVEMIDNGEREEDKREICFRGLEDKSSEASKRRRHTKQEACEVVLYAQEAQCDELLSGNLDWEPIREAYLSVSSDSSSVAQEVGLSDAFNAWGGYLKSTGDDAQKLRLSTRPIMQSPRLQHHRSLSHVF
ncbi:unnamed protein product [Cylindrotheca closterium]|uniref:Uncharacterized protein n=1 Tax=Cylindrotheca closterium TaxID=2856 RepID=A0AAD2FWN7_9STRA|nr:unnamed protein product [Cylindrotheca closterium]